MAALILAVAVLPIAFFFGWFWRNVIRRSARWRDTLIVLPFGLIVFGAGFVLREAPAGSSLDTSTLGYTVIVGSWIAAGAAGLLLGMRRADRSRRSDPVPGGAGGAAPVERG